MAETKLIRPNILLKELQTILEIETAEYGYKSYVKTIDYDRELLLTLTKDGININHVFYLYWKLSEEYLKEATREFAQLYIHDKYAQE